MRILRLPKDFLSQASYKDENGKDVPANEVDNITTYKYIADGFYKWVCAECGEVTGSRSCGWQIMGQVLGCPKCGEKNLLLWNGTNDLQIWKLKQCDVDFAKMASEIDNIGYKALNLGRELRKLEIKQ